MSMNVQGMDELLQKLNQLGDKAESIKEKAIAEGAELFRQEMEIKAPRGTGAKHIAENIIVEMKDEAAVIGPSKDFFYGHFLEFGTKKMSARPFMGPAYENKKRDAKEKMAEVIREELGL